MSILAFQKPDRVIMQKANDFHGTFEFRPLEAGFGTTVGNAIRRILLSSLEGYAISSIKVSDVLHEFTTIKGVVEDVTEVVLNLKQVRFKKKGDLGNSEKIVVSVQNKSTLTGKDIADASANFEVTNPDIVICNLEENVTFQLELNITKGRGYMPAELIKLGDQQIGVINLDAIYTPIKNVNYKIENFRVEQITDYEKLVIEIETDGSIHPEDALKQAAKILIQHFLLFSDENITMETSNIDAQQEVNEEILKMSKILNMKLEDLDLSVRALNCLKAANISTLADLVSCDIVDLLKFRNFGKKSLTEIEELVRSKGLSFGMNLSKFKIDEPVQ